MHRRRQERTRPGGLTALHPGFRTFLAFRALPAFREIRETRKIRRGRFAGVLAAALVVALLSGPAQAAAQEPVNDTSATRETPADAAGERPALSIPRLEAPPLPAPPCKTCSGAGTVGCKPCKASGELSARCERCRGRDTIECTSTGCDKGEKACENCNGRGSIVVESIGVSGGGGARRKDCGGCSGKGSVDCRACDRGRKRCFRCQGGKKQFTRPCTHCEGSATATCKICKGAATSKSKPLNRHQQMALRRATNDLREASSIVNELHAKLASSRSETATSDESIAGVEEQLAAMRRRPTAELSQYLQRFREVVEVDWKRFSRKYLDNEARDRARIALEQRLGTLREVATGSINEIDRIVEKYDEQSSEHVESFLTELGRTVAAADEEASQLEIEVFKLGRLVDKRRDDLAAIRDDLEEFDRRSLLHAEKVASAARTERVERMKETPRDAFKKTLHRANLDTGLPRLGIDDSSSRLEGASLELTVHYLDNGAKPIGETRYFDLREDYLEKIPGVVGSLFESRPELSQIALEIQARVDTSGSGSSRSRTVATIQQFTFGRTAWRRAAPGLEPNENGETDRSTWVEYLSASAPYPDYPPPGLEDMTLVRILLWVGLIIAGGAAALILGRMAAR